MLVPTEILWVALAFLVVAFFYSSVGFGGGSSYLAILTLVFTSFFVIRSAALVCNLVVVSGSTILYLRKGHVDFKKFLPFLITSIPMAFLGASFRLTEKVFFVLLGIALIVAAGALVTQTLQLKKEYEPSSYPKYLPYAIGGLVGLLSGLVGIGGGIFLAPLLNQLKWERPLKIAALASLFILLNSVSGILGLVNAGTFELPWPEIALLIGAVLLGGQLGARLSIGRFSGKTIRLLTALLVFAVGLKVFLDNGLS